ncbi:hypothetical protein Tco_0584134 [Tanacetum coccineum]
MALWIVDNTIPILCMAVLLSSRLCGELDLTMKKFRTSVRVRGLSPIVISKGTSLRGQEHSPEKPTSGTFESTLSDLIEGFNFRKKCSQMTSHELPLSKYTRFTCLLDIWAFMMTGSEELLMPKTRGM